MSVIVIRDGVIAADTGGSLGGITFYSKKLYRKGNIAIGWTGNAVDGQTFSEWYFAGSDMDNLPKFHNREGHDPAIHFNALVLKPEGWEYWDDWFVCDKEMGQNNHYMAIGAGSRIAQGALYMGATAIQAVEAACNAGEYCHLPIVCEEINQV